MNDITLVDTPERIDWHALSALYRAAPLGDKSPDWLRSAFGASRLRVFAFDGSRLVGAGRALGDGVDCAYLCDIAVLPAYQGNGIGKRIVSELVARARGHAKIILYSVPGREGFYRALGFLPMRTAMAQFADRDAAVAGGYVDAA